MEGEERKNRTGKNDFVLYLCVCVYERESEREREREREKESERPKSLPRECHKPAPAGEMQHRT